MMKIYEKLAAIQAELHAPKSQYNKFGNYSYRKAEDILEAVKPLLQKNACLLNCTDDLVLCGERYYIKATACITAIEDGSQVCTTAFAREELEKKGMDGSQVTGASSSYARKYALNGLLCIDDTADSDVTNTGDAAPVKPAKTAKTVKKAAASEEKKAYTKKEYPPEKGSAEWLRWVKAIATGAPSKAGDKVDWRVAFQERFSYNEEIMNDLDADVFDFRVDNDIRATE